MRTARQHNAPLVGEVTLDAGSKANPTSPRDGDESVAAEPARVGFKPATTDEQKLNKTERAFLQKLRSEDWEVGIQDITVKLGDDCRYTPDFNAYDPIIGKMVFWEVKGFMRDDALVKLKVAARKCYTWAKFLLVKKEKGALGVYRWSITEVNP